MGQIKILSKQISNRIAAGEVIERPSSVVKELIDNAIDAQATRIQILIENGGTNLIQVNDNGVGMNKEDALLSLESHATSKISTVEDLDNLYTFGFRGEALPSISSISQFTLITKQNNSIEGTKIIADGGIIRSVKAAGRPTGTSIIISNLFYNVPARKKFLKTKATEESHIHEMVLLAALARKDIAFELKFNNRKIFTTPETTDIRSRLILLFGKDMIRHILPVQYSEDSINISGFAIDPSFTRSSRKDQKTFINSRPVIADCLYLGIKEAYHTLIAKARFAPVILYYTLKPNRFDINVHPAKREIRFQEPSLLSRITTQAISFALRGITQDEIAHQKKILKFQPTSRIPFNITPINNNSLTKNTQIKPDSNEITNVKNIPQPDISSIQSNKHLTPIIQNHNNLQKINYLAELQQKYILSENSSGLIIINKKAALERILFEKLMHNFKKQIIESQTLLIPVNLDIPQNDVIYLKKTNKKLKKFGFDIEHFGGNSFIITAIPAHLPYDNIQKLIFDIIDELRETQEKIVNIKEINLLKFISQKASNASQISGKKQCEELIKDLITCEMPYACPKGKASILFISTSKLIRHFGKN